VFEPVPLIKEYRSKVSDPTDRTDRTDQIFIVHFAGNLSDIGPGSIVYAEGISFFGRIPERRNKTYYCMMLYNSGSDWTLVVGEGMPVESP